MMTILWTFLKNPKNLALLVLAICLFICGTVVLVQRASLAKSKGKIELQSVEIERYKAAQKAYTELINQYAEQVVKWQKLAEKQQDITNQTAKVVTKIKYVKTNCKVEKEDAKIVNGIAEYFNTGRLRD
jgi:predicted Holliday junction resolvase-like endonuclease